MGETNSTQIRPIFNRSLAIAGGDERLTNLPGVVCLRELDEKLGLTRDVADELEDPRDPSRVEHSMSSLLRSWTYTMAAHFLHSTFHVTAGHGSGTEASRVGQQGGRWIGIPSGQFRESGGKRGGSRGRTVGWIVGNCLPNGVSGAGIGGAVAAKKAGFGVGTIRQ